MKQNNHSEISEVRVRFAPSPTGTPHLGNLRVATYNYMFAKKHGGKFYLRFEDTDRERSTLEHEETMRDILNWLDLSYEKDVWRQSERGLVYDKYANKLLEGKKVYYCNCSHANSESEEIEEEPTEKKTYTHHKCDCLGKNLQEGALRFIVPKDTQLEFTDMVLGKLVINSNTLENFVIRRSDGNYTYNFVVVVDDIEMKITHVIRGIDHVYNTHKQLLIYKALNVTPPIFAHIPLIGGEGGQKLSKRLGTGNIMYYKKEIGVSPYGMFNYLIKLSGGYGDKEILSREEAIEEFDLTKISKSQAAFDLNKLLHLSGHYIAKYPKKHFAELFNFLREASGGLHTSIENFLRINPLISEFAKRSETLKQLAESLIFVYKDIELSEQNIKLLNKSLLEEIIEILNKISDFDPEMSNEYFQISGDQWTEENLHNILKTHFKNRLGEACEQIRISLLNTNASPSIFLILAHLGKRDTIKKLKLALNYLSK